MLKNSKAVLGSRNNHYVPIWYQKGFTKGQDAVLYYLDLNPAHPRRSDGTEIKISGCSKRAKPLDKCFCHFDLYSTFFNTQFGFRLVNVEIEQRLFGQIDGKGAKAVRAFIQGGVQKYHDHFEEFFKYIDAQKLRTIKGLEWVKAQYPSLDQNQLMMEMQAIRSRHCTIWTEGVREIVTAKNSPVGFIVTDHPVTVYNYALPPGEGQNKYPNDPSILLKGSQTIFPLDKEHCLILTNYEYAKDPDGANPCENRTNPVFIRQSMVRTDAFIRKRDLSESDVKKINLLLKLQARQFIAAPEKDWLYPERDTKLDWKDLKKVLLPPANELWGFGGEMFFGTEGGKSHYQDAFGRSTPENPYLRKRVPEKPKANLPCVCGSGKKWKRCCRDKPLAGRGITTHKSIRERNILFCRGVKNILGLNEGKTWDDVRATLSDVQVKDIHELVSFFWPIDTNIAELLPHPDGSNRALYAGQIDPRVIAGFAINSTLYFDEVLIQSPFLNPGHMMPDFNPVKNPSMYKQQVLSDVMLLLMLEPFIHLGYINLIPDPCIFSKFLQRQMFEMAKERTKGFKLDDKSFEEYKGLHEDSVNRSFRGLSKEQLRVQIRRTDPDISDEKIENIIEYMHRQRQADPLSLLQDDIYNGKGGQMMLSCLAPNFEMALFIAQMTGSVLITDDKWRWNECCGVFKNASELIPPVWQETAKIMADHQWLGNLNPECVFKLRAAGRLGQLRKVFGDLMELARSQRIIPPENLVSRLEAINNALSKALVNAQVEITRAVDESGQKLPDAEQYQFGFKLEPMVPAKGIYHNNVHRMLLTYGSDHHTNTVPMAFFASYSSNDTANEV